MWQVRLRIRFTRPRARGRQRLSVGPSSATAVRTNRSSTSWPLLFSALAIADASTLPASRAAALVWKARMVVASAADLPRMCSSTRRALRADVRT